MTLQARALAEVLMVMVIVMAKAMMTMTVAFSGGGIKSGFLLCSRQSEGQKRLTGRWEPITLCMKRRFMGKTSPEVFNIGHWIEDGFRSNKGRILVL